MAAVKGGMLTSNSQTKNFTTNLEKLSELRVPERNVLFPLT
jgi:hypothetical protein